MMIFLIVLGLIIVLAFLMGMYAGSVRKEKEYQELIDMIFQRRYIVQERDIDPRIGEESEVEFMVMKNDNALNPVFLKHSNNN